MGVSKNSTDLCGRCGTERYREADLFHVLKYSLVPQICVLPPFEIQCLG